MVKDAMSISMEGSLFFKSNRGMMAVDGMILGVLLFISVCIGAGIAWFVFRLFKHSTGKLALLCGGFLLGLLLLDVIPSAFGLYAPFGIIVGVLLGYFLFEALHSLFHSSGPSASVYMLAVAMLLHTIPISMMIGSLHDDSALSLSISTSVILHHLPEGFALTSLVLSKGDKFWGLVLCFLALSVCFTLFIWVGEYAFLTAKLQSILMGVSISLFACTSVKEFIGQHVHTVPLRTLLSYVSLGFLFSSVFHFLL